jgi:hypothetical protein
MKSRVSNKRGNPSKLRHGKRPARSLKTWLRYRAKQRAIRARLEAQARADSLREALAKADI